MSRFVLAKCIDGEITQNISDFIYIFFFTSINRAKGFRFPTWAIYVTANQSSN